MGGTGRRPMWTVPSSSQDQLRSFQSASCWAMKIAVPEDAGATLLSSCLADPRVRHQLAVFVAESLTLALDEVVSHR